MLIVIVLGWFLSRYFTSSLKVDKARVSSGITSLVLLWMDFVKLGTKRPVYSHYLSVP